MRARKYRLGKPKLRFNDASLVIERSFISDFTGFSRAGLFMVN